MSENRLIDAHALLEKVQFRLPIDNQNAEVISGCVNIARRLIENAPTVGVVEVVRCEHCRHSDTISCPEGRVWCNHMTRYMKKDGFCSEGKENIDEQQ